MTTVPSPVAVRRSMADLLEHLGGISPARVRLYPYPGTATEADVVAVEASENRLCELIDGVLVEKPMGFRESLIAGPILTALNNFVVPRKLGVVTGADGMMRLFAGMVRIPDVAFVSRDRLPGGRVPAGPVPHLAPDLAVEVLSESNTEAEMDQQAPGLLRRRASAWSGSWTRASAVADVYTTPGPPLRLVEGQTLDGGNVLPGLTLDLRSLFAAFDEIRLDLAADAPGTRQGLPDGRPCCFTLLF